MERKRDITPAVNKRMNLLHIFLSVVKARSIKLWNGFQRLRDPNYLKSRASAKIQDFFHSLLNVRPRDKTDYYVLFGWQVSKKLAFVILTGVGILSAYYLFELNAASFFPTSAQGIRTYFYDDLMLRFTDAKVRIRGKSGYLAYEGTVKKGAAEGEGSLFGPDGSLVYRGSFVRNRYEGEGSLYYPGGQIKYQGGFRENLYEGNGSLYRENGSLEYQGSFSRGYREGAGTLYDAGGNPVYQGNFSRDRLLYGELPGKSAQELSGIYTGKRVIYTDEDYFAVFLSDIEAVYYAQGKADLLDESVKIQGIYVLQDYFYQDGNKLETIGELAEGMGPVSYEGNSAVTMPEAVVMTILQHKGKKPYETAVLETEKVFEDVIQVHSYDMDYLIYLYSIEQNGLLYTFYCRDKLGKFDFYSIERVG